MAVLSEAMIFVHCALCESELAIGETQEAATCSLCGTMLAIRRAPARITTSHTGERLGAVQESLETAALERSLQALRARRESVAAAAKVRSFTIRLRRGLSWLALGAWLVGLGCLVVGQAIAGGTLFVLGVVGFITTLLVRRDGAGNSMVAEMRQVRQARAAAIELRGLDHEIGERRRVLKAISDRDRTAQVPVQD